MVKYLFLALLAGCSVTKKGAIRGEAESRLESCMYHATKADIPICKRESIEFCLNK